MEPNAFSPRHESFDAYDITGLLDHVKSENSKKTPRKTPSKMDGNYGSPSTMIKRDDYSEISFSTPRAAPLGARFRTSLRRSGKKKKGYFIGKGKDDNGISPLKLQFDEFGTKSNVQAQTIIRVTAPSSFQMQVDSRQDEVVDDNQALGDTFGSTTTTAAGRDDIYQMAAKREDQNHTTACTELEQPTDPTSMYQIYTPPPKNRGFHSRSRSGSSTSSPIWMFMSHDAELV